MLRKSTILYLVVSSIVIYSCKKSNSAGSSGDTGQLVGNYQFLYLGAVTSATTEESAAGQTEKIISNSNYTTVQNSGTVTITKDSFASINLGYTVNTITTAYDYENGVLSDSFSFPVTETIAAYSSVTKYDLIGKDSLYFQGGYITSGVGSGSTNSTPSGGRFSFKGDTLFIVSKIQQTSPPQNSGGITASSSQAAIATIALLKQ